MKNTIKNMTILILLTGLSIFPTLSMANSLYLSLTVQPEVTGNFSSLLSETGSIGHSFESSAHITVLKLRDVKANIPKIIDYYEARLTELLDQLQVKPVFFYADQISMIQLAKSTVVLLENSKMRNGATDAVFSLRNNYLTKCASKNNKDLEKFSVFTSALERALKGEDEDGFTSSYFEINRSQWNLDATFPHVTLDKYPSSQVNDSQMISRIQNLGFEDLEEGCKERIRYRITGYYIYSQIGEKIVRIVKRTPTPKNSL